MRERAWPRGQTLAADDGADQKWPGLSGANSSYGTTRVRDFRESSPAGGAGQSDLACARGGQGWVELICVAGSCENRQPGSRASRGALVDHEPRIAGGCWRSRASRCRRFRLRPRSRSCRSIALDPVVPGSARAPAARAGVTRLASRKKRERRDSERDRSAVEIEEQGVPGLIGSDRWRRSRPALAAVPVVPVLPVLPVVDRTRPRLRGAPASRPPWVPDLGTSPSRLANDGPSPPRHRSTSPPGSKVRGSRNWFRDFSRQEPRSATRVESGAVERPR